MSKFIEEFYNVNSTQRKWQKNKPVPNKMAVLRKTDNQLTDPLKDDLKNWFIDFFNVWSNIYLN